MKFSIDNKKAKNMEDVINNINKIKNNCTENGNLQDFIHTVNTFNDMANDDITYICNEEGNIYIENPSHIDSCGGQFFYNNVVSYGIEGDKLILYLLQYNLRKIALTVDGRYECLHD
ncbi:hypothetical protein RBU49_03025 [Clostridium sp. MB40-C1]|uniref:hypothetical protein n=1 Tax=Clostridium sp. MB40-C1 TaxID=3070996 RepID=UPI0027E13CE8|nr:hypothetical protein [Clostridium sp. MB40-C1]WMJ81243.1 hypothetical protein RBU49_03025 [Clostridium sp. MB40-C1]